MLENSWYFFQRANGLKEPSILWIWATYRTLLRWKSSVDRGMQVRDASNAWNPIHVLMTVLFSRPNPYPRLQWWGEPDTWIRISAAKPKLPWALRTLPGNVCLAKATGFLSAAWIPNSVCRTKCQWSFNQAADTPAYIVCDAFSLPPRSSDTRGCLDSFSIVTKEDRAYPVSIYIASFWS